MQLRQTDKQVMQSGNSSNITSCKMLMRHVNGHYIAIFYMKYNSFNQFGHEKVFFLGIKSGIGIGFGSLAGGSCCQFSIFLLISSNKFCPAVLVGSSLRLWPADRAHEHVKHCFAL